MVNFGYPYNDIVICKDSTDYPANNAEQVRFNFVPTLTEQLFRLCDRNSFQLSYENVHLFVTTLCQLNRNKVGTKLDHRSVSVTIVGTNLCQIWSNFEPHLERL